MQMLGMSNIRANYRTGMRAARTYTRFFFIRFTTVAYLLVKYSRLLSTRAIRLPLPHYFVWGYSACGGSLITGGFVFIIVGCNVSNCDT